MANQNFKFTENQRFLRGLLFISAGAFMVIRFAAGETTPFFVYAAWFTAIVALGTLVLYIWSVFQEIE